MKSRVRTLFCRINALVFTVAMLLTFTYVGANAQNEPIAPSYPEELSLSVAVKRDASAASIRTAIEEKLKADNTDYPIEAITWAEGVDFTLGGTVDTAVRYTGGSTATAHINVTPVVFTGTVAFAKELAAIASNSSNNVSQTALLAYINSDLTLAPAGDSSYDAALGTAPTAGTAPTFAWRHCNASYTPSGGAYTFTQEYNGTPLTRTVIVNHTSHSLGGLSINYGTSTVNTSRYMRWNDSRNTNSWSYCSENMVIPSMWYGRTIYFYIPADQYADDSNTVSLYVPDKADRPTENLELTATTHSVTIQNCWDFDDVEYSLNNSDWRTTKNDVYTFENLKPDTTYTVYVRSRASSGQYLASDSIYRAIRTKVAPATNIEVDTSVSGNTGYINASGTIASDINSHTLSGRLTSSNLTKYNNVFDTFSKRYNNVSANLLIEQYVDVDETTDIGTINFSMPISAIYKTIQNAKLEVEYRNDMGRVYLDNSALKALYKSSTSGTISISMQTVNTINSGSSWDWLRGEYKSGAHVYKLSVTCGSKKDAGITYFLPYKPTGNVTISSLAVYYVNGSGKQTSLPFTYDDTLGGVKFTSSEAGYFVITHNGTVSVPIPFRDVPTNFWARPHIQYCYDKGLFLGTSATMFSPLETISRAQIVALLSRLDGFDGRFSGQSRFTDISSQDWFAPYAEWAYDKGLVYGNTFNGTDSMSRQDIALMLYTYLQKSGHKVTFNENSIPKYDDDNSIGYTNRTAVYFMRYTGIMVGTGANTFSPVSPVTRAEMAALMQRLADYLL